MFDADRLIAALPRRLIGELPPNTLIRRRKGNATSNSHNGFSAEERNRTFEVWKWLNRAGAIQPHSGKVRNLPSESRSTARCIFL